MSGEFTLSCNDTILYLSGIGIYNLSNKEEWNPIFPKNLVSKNHSFSIPENTSRLFKTNDENYLIYSKN
jgi:hypothetical protein